MSQIIDIQSGWHHTKKFFDGIPMPAVVKEALEIQPEELTGLPTSSFADPTYRRFPCHTKAATVISYLLFTDQEDKFPAKQRLSIENSFVKKAVYWGVLDQMQKAGTAWRHRSDPAPFTDDDFAMIIHSGDKTHKALPIRNQCELQAATDHLKKYSGFYPMPQRQKAAQKILKRAGLLDIKPADIDYLNVMAHTEPAYPSDIAPHVLKRAGLVMKEDSQLSASLKKIASTLQSTTVAPNRKISETVCGFLAEADTKARLHKLYGQIPTPEEACFSTLSKRAKALKEATVQLVSGHIYTTKDLVKAGLEVYKATDPELASSLSSNGKLDPVKVAEIVPTLPLPEARRLQYNLHAVGIKKMSFSRLNKKSASHRLSEAAWKAFAAEAGLEPDNTGERFSLTFRPGESTLERAEKNRTKGLLDL